MSWVEAVPARLPDCGEAQATHTFDCAKLQVIEMLLLSS